MPFTCERCGYTFGRWIKECIELGIKCPRCNFRMDLSTDELEEVVAMVEACHQAEDLSREDDGGADEDD